MKNREFTHMVIDYVAIVLFIGLIGHTAFMLITNR